MGSLSQIRLEDRNTVEETGAPLISIKDLTLDYRKETGLFIRRVSKVRALDHVSLDIYHSEFVSIVGETGSGKTTLGKCLVGLERPTFGQIYFDGRDVSKLARTNFRHYTREIQMIFQDPFESLLPRQDVYTTIATPIRNLRGERRKEVLVENVSRLLEEVGLRPEEVMQRLPHQLSGGQRQRVSIARALASNPRLLIADEPITMLDASQRLNVLSLLTNLRAKRGLTVVMITHDLPSAKITSDRIVVMYLGKVVELASASTLVSRPHHPYVELMLASHASLTDVMAEKVKQKGEMGEARPEKGCVFEPRCRYATEVCKVEEPPLAEMDPRHYAACYHPLNKEDGETSPEPKN